MLQLKIVIGSTRPGRTFSVEVLDLREWALPMFAETSETVGDPRSPTFSDASVRRWNEAVASGDAFLFLTPEYTHSLPAVLKNGLGSVFATFAFRNTPCASVAYSGGPIGGARAIEHLALVAVEAEMVPLRNNILLPYVGAAFEAEGNPTDPRTEAVGRIVLGDLAWWGEALRAARAEGELSPAMARLMSTTNHR